MPSSLASASSDAEPDEILPGHARRVDPLGMLVCMRTTINLPDALAAAAKERAAAQGRTFTSLIEQGLRVVLDQSDDDSGHVELPVFDPPPGGRGMLVDITDKQAVWEALDADGAA